MRPGGGLTVVKILTERLLRESGADIEVVVGDADAGDVLRRSFATDPRVRVRMFMPSASPVVRMLASKAWFLWWSAFGTRSKVLFSINFWQPALCRTVVYHVNLLNFMRLESDDRAKRIRDADALLACRFASLNAFESRFLLNAARARSVRPIRNAQILYVGIDRVFDVPSFSPTASPELGRLALVSSTQPHKDNETCLRALALLTQLHSDVPWHLHVFGGQAIAQWDRFFMRADELGVSASVTVHGPVPKTELARALSVSVCLMLASRVESFAMVPLEAMACGCPAIATDEASMPESLGDAAIMVAAGDAEAFAYATLSLATDPALRRRHVEAGLARAADFREEALVGDLGGLMASIQIGGEGVPQPTSTQRG